MKVIIHSMVWNHQAVMQKNTFSHVSGSNVFQTMKTYVVY
jgi:hypothetical protein